MGCSKILLFIIAFVVLGSTNTNAQSIHDVKVSLSFKRLPLKDVLSHLETITPFKFLAAAEDIEHVQIIDLYSKDEPLDSLIKRILIPNGLQATQSGYNVFIKKAEQPTSLQRSRSYAFHGTIKSKRTGESLIGASIWIPLISRGTTSNEYGFFSITLPAGSHIVHASAVGMQAVSFNLNLDTSRQVQIDLNDDTSMLEAVTLRTTTSSRDIRNPYMGVEKINVKDIRTIPVIFGERDLLKSMQLLPGIKQAAEGNSGFYVRGGGLDQNLILLDEAPVYNPSHLLGFFSTFNTDAIKNVTVYKGGMPPQYGGRLSSAVDIRMNDGNNQNYQVSGGLGLIASRLNIEGPLQKNKSSFLLSGRRTYADLFLKLLGDSSLRTARLNFYDLNVKMNYILGEKDRLYISGYFGRDVLSQEDLAGINWGNATGTLRWNHIFNSKLFSNSSLIFSKYDYKIFTNSESTDFEILSRIKDWNLKQEMQWYPSSSSTFIFGANSIYHTITPGEISVTGNIGRVDQGLPDRYSIENALYAGNTWRSDRITIATGARLSLFSILARQEDEVAKTYINLEPRISASLQLNENSSFKASYTRNTQNLHLISNSSSSSPTDKWVASSNVIKPEIADQFALGWFRNITGNKYEVSAEVYYKSMQNQIDYRNGAKVFSNEPIESQLLFGEGRAYGIEWLWRKKAGRLTGWIAYTLSKTERKIIGISNNQWYNARQDRTHDIAVVAMYELNKKWTLSANWVYYSGDAVTYPTGKYSLDGEVYFYYSERNGYRTPDYHRLDIGATRQLKKTKRFTTELVFSLFNAYGRANAYQVSFRESKEDPQRTEAVQTSLFTFVPSISWNFKF